MVIVFDLDGTICFNGQSVAREILDVLAAMQETGQRIIIASARPIRDIYPVLPKWMQSMDMVGGNGSFVKCGEDISVRGFNCVAQLRAIIEKHNLPYLADSRWDYAYTGPEGHPIRRQVDSGQLARQVAIDELGEIVKMALFTKDEQIAQQLMTLPIELYRHADEGIFDLTPQHVTKWSGLQALGVAEGEFIAVGNDTNDIPMFLHAREAICVGMHPEASTYAHKTVQQEHVANFLATRFLSRNL